MSMAGDRGALSGGRDAAAVPYETDEHDRDGESLLPHGRSDTTTPHETTAEEPASDFLAAQSAQPQFTLRAFLVGAVVGVVIAFSNTYFGLQTGWISGMAMPSALIGFAYFQGLRTLAASLGERIQRLGFGEGFSEVENVLVQTVAGAVGTMPLGCGFVGVIPALEFLLKPSESPITDSSNPSVVQTLIAAEEHGGVRLPLGRLILWAMGLCFFGVVMAVPLRKEVIIREKLKFPSGTATALMIGVLHGGEKTGVEGDIERHAARRRRHGNVGHDEEREALIRATSPTSEQTGYRQSQVDGQTDSLARSKAVNRDWKKQIGLLTLSFFSSGIYTVVSYFIPQLHSIPILGTYMANNWEWTFNLSPAYVAQGIIMGPATTIHMFLGALLGWAVLSPMAKYAGWAPGPVPDWNTGSQGWIVWVSLAIMLADSFVNLGWLVLRPIVWYTRNHGPRVMNDIRQKGMRGYLQEANPFLHRQGRRPNTEATRSLGKSTTHGDSEQDTYDAPPEHQIGVKTTIIGAILTLVFCVVAVYYAFLGIIGVGSIVLSIVLALLLSIMGVRALGETDLNPVSGISKLTQLVFALVTPTGSRNAVAINLIAGGISEAGALQAGDLLQDLKTGHLLGASPKAQFYGQLLGSGIGAVVSAAVYKLYTEVYTIPGGLFQVPTAYVWVFTARLVTGRGLPAKVPEFATAAAVLWAFLTALRIYGNSKNAKWVPFIPGGIAVAVGMYNTPSFTIARTIGGLLYWYWVGLKKRSETPIIVIASGLILGEGLLSIVNLVLASLHVSHL